MENNIIKKKPTGGFPPIFICDKNGQKIDKEDKNEKIRGFSKEEEKIVASLKEIMEERRTNVEPFITF